MSTQKIVAALTAWLTGGVCVQAATYQVGPSRTYHTVGSLPSLSAGDIRVTSGNNVTVRNCRIAMCDMGIMCDNNSNLIIEASEICSNGTSLYDGYSHNFYLGGKSATVRFCYIHDSLYGRSARALLQAAIVAVRRSNEYLEPVPKERIVAIT
jgi:hypothetical protein